MDWNQLVIATVTAIVSTGVVATLVAGRKGRARKALKEEIEIFKSLPAGVPGKADFARDLSFTLQEYWSPVPSELRHQTRVARAGTLLSALIGFVAFCIGWAAAPNDIDAIVPPAPEDPHTPAFWVYWIGGAVALVSLLGALWNEALGRRAMARSNTWASRATKTEDSGLMAEIRLMLHTASSPLNASGPPDPEHRREGGDGSGVS